MAKRINSLKVVLAEKQRTNKCLANDLDINPSIVSKWCTNPSKPDITLLLRISKLLDVELKELINEEFVESL